MATPNPNDPDVINLSKAIFKRESGGNFDAVGDAGTSHGAGQWQPGTWKSQAKQVLGNEAAEMTPENQKAVIQGSVAIDKANGLNPAQIAAKWNSGSPTGWENKIGTTTINGQQIKYNVPQYVKDVTDYYQQFKVESGQQVADTSIPEPTTPENKSSALFPPKENDTPLISGAKTLGNLLPSAFNFVKGAIDTVNPISTIGRLPQIPGVIGDIVSQHQTPGQLTGNLAQGVYESIVPQFGRQLVAGDTQGAQQSVTEDPVGSIAPFLLAGRGGLKTADSAITRSRIAEYARAPYGKEFPQPSQMVSAFDNAISSTTKIAKPVTVPITKTIGAVGNLAGKTADFTVRQATGLGGDTRKIITENPKAFTKENRGKADRASLAEEIKTKLDERTDALDESQAAYKPIRESATKINIDPNFIENAISDVAKVNYSKGKIRATGESMVRESADIAALQQLSDFWKPIFKKGHLTTSEFLNFRSDLAKMAKYGKDLGKSKPVESVGSVVRGKFNTAYRNQILGLEDLDATMASQIKDFANVKKGLLDKDGNLTDGAVTRIANATNKGRDMVLERLEEISPGITQRIRIVKALEDIEKATENKVGTYARGALAAGSALTMNIPGLIATILTQPEVAVPILRQYGYAKPLVDTVKKSLKDSLNTLNTIPERGALPSVLPANLPEHPASLARQ